MIPQETVTTAAKALFDIRDDAYDMDEWEDLDSTDRELYECQALAALEAAAPILRAQALEDAADEWERRSDAFLRTMQNMSELIGTYTHDDIVRYGAYSAEANTTAHRLRARAATERGQHD